jgi:hypothetical protein
MKRGALLWVGFAGFTLLFSARCAQEGPGSTPGTAGTTGSAGTTAAAGTTGAAGTSAAAGTNGAAGTSAVAGTNGAAGAAGTNATAGTTGAAGTSAAAGTTGNAGTTGAAGTTGDAGTSGGAGTVGNAGRGGTTGNAGRGGTTGNAGRGGTTGTAGSGAGGTGPLDINTIVPGFDGYYWEVSPSGNTSLTGTNYPFGPPAGGCPTGANWDATGYINTKPALTVGGTPGQKYTININVRGVVGTRCYTGGTPASTAAGNPSGQNNTWYAGGRQANDSIWNTMEVRVAPKVQGQANQPNSAYDIYFMNSFNTSAWCQKEATYEARFNAAFPVMGGGTITLVVHDSNCRTLANCGSVEQQQSCNTSAARIIDMAGVTPAAMNFNQPRTGTLSGSTYYLQWVWIDVTSVTSP